MENAVSALKIAFAMFIFLLGLSILFFMSSQARETASIIIAGTDKTNDYIYYEDYKEDVKEDYIDKNGNRIVQMKDMIPTIYRYSEENYGVTIVDEGGDIVARFDLDTENICNRWLNINDKVKENFIRETNDVLSKVNKLADHVGKNRVNPIKEKNGDKYGEIIELFKKLYSQDYNATIRREYYCNWVRKNGVYSSKNRLRLISE